MPVIAETVPSNVWHGDGGHDEKTDHNGTRDCWEGKGSRDELNGEQANDWIYSPPSSNPSAAGWANVTSRT
jgi:hypothetical protein